MPGVSLSGASTSSPTTHTRSSATTARRHADPMASVESSEYLVTLGSLSKTLGMTGWRIGYMVADPGLIRQALKVQDATAICAPIIAQVAATAALEQMPAYPLGMIEELNERRDMLQSVVDESPALHWHRTNGALFAMVRAEAVGGDRRELESELAGAGPRADRSRQGLRHPVERLHQGLVRLLTEGPLRGGAGESGRVLRDILTVFNQLCPTSPSC